MEHICESHQAQGLSGGKLAVCVACQKRYSLKCGSKLPIEVKDRFEEWCREGRPVQYASPIDRKKWPYVSDRLELFLDSLEVVQCIDGWERTMIPRAAAIEFTRNAHLKAEYALDAHAISFMWGKGLSGLGPTHLKSSLETTDSPLGVGKNTMSVADRLLHVVLTLREKGPLAAFELFVASNSRFKLDKCGPSFVTKDLFFFSDDSDHNRALILDSYVLEFFRRIGCPLREGSVHDYGAYLLAMYTWADELGVTPDEIEVIVFGWKLSQLDQSSLRNWDPCYKSVPVDWP